MKLLFKRIVRTPYSEQYALFDQEQLDAEQLPLSLGKVDLHYTPEGTFGTLMLWSSAFAACSADDLQAFVQEVMDEFSGPMGVSGEFLVETALIGEQDVSVFSNMVGASQDEEGA